jgi:hypothetical protein
MPTLRPGLRQYSELDVINLFTLSGGAALNGVINKGTLVAPVLSGWNSLAEPVDMIGDFGGFNEPNTVATRWGVTPKITVAGTGDIPLGITLMDQRELDENGVYLKYNPRKQAEMEAILSGQAMPVVTRGIFLYSGITGNPNLGASLYAGPAGVIDDYAGPTGNVPAVARVGKVLGKKDAKGFTLIKLEL